MVGNASKLLGIATFMLAGTAAADLPGHEPHLAGRGALGAELGGTLGYQGGSRLRGELWDVSFLASLTGRYFVADGFALGLALGFQRTSRDACLVVCITTPRSAGVAMATVAYFGALSRTAYVVPELGLGAFGGGEEQTSGPAVPGVALPPSSSEAVYGAIGRIGLGFAFVPWPRLWVFVRPDLTATLSSQKSTLDRRPARLDLDLGATVGVSRAF